VSIVIELRRRDLMQLATAYILANTPISLYHALMRTEALQKLRENASREELAEYYDKLTARPGRSTGTMALAYAVLLATLSKNDGGESKLDSSRLEWGPVVERAARSANPPTTSTTIVVPTAQVRVDMQASPASRIIIP
jgi:hypothetical protein